MANPPRTSILISLLLALLMPWMAAQADTPLTSQTAVNRAAQVGLLHADPGFSLQLAQADTAKATPLAEVPDIPPLLPFVPPPEEFDWIQLTSDEWLKGELKAMYKEKLEFDSDELDLQTFDWEDVRQVWTHGRQSIRIEDVKGGEPRIIYGVLRVIDDRIIVINQSGAKEFRRTQLVSIAPRAEKELQRWSGDITLGANFQEGNSDQVEYSAIVGVKRRTAASRFLLDYIGTLNQVESVETSNNQRVTTSFDEFKTRRYFWRLVFGEYFRDPFQNIRYRWTAGSAFGYTIIDTARTEWDLTIGGGFQYLKFVSVEPGQNIENSTPLMSFTTLFDTELTSWIDYDLNYSFYLVDKDAGTYTHHFVSSVETDLIGNIDFDISFVWDRIQDPQPASDGTVPEQNDFRLIVGLGWDF
jgi:hypothetical protein